jgi:hypothetical protein
MPATRSYIAGIGAGGALVGGAIVIFLSVAALVAFNGVQGGFEDSGVESVSVGSSVAPTVSVTALSPPRGGGGGEVPDRAGSGAGGDSEPGVAPRSGNATGGTGEIAPGVNTPSTPGAAPTAQPGTGGAPPASGTGPVGGVVDQVDGAAGGLGLGTGLGDATGPITDPVDEALQDTLPDLTGGS